jgi:uncharacterized protein (DUF488 family)
MSETIEISTIGFTKTSADSFFNRLIKANVKKVFDVRLHNTSQLAGFAKSQDLAFFLKKIGNIEYVHKPIMAPTDDILKTFKKEKGDWKVYESKFLDIMERRKIEEKFLPTDLNGVCLLCSEDKPHECHRRLVAEYLNSKWNGVLQIRHL